MPHVDTNKARSRQDADMAALLAAYEAEMAAYLERVVSESQEGQRAAGSRQGGTDASSGRLTVSECPRCGGRLYSEPCVLEDGTREMACLNCGARSYR